MLIYLCGQKEFGWWLQYSTVRNLCAGCTAVFWLTEHTGCVSRSDCRISERMNARILRYCLVARHRGVPCLVPFAILSSFVFPLALYLVASSFSQLCHSASLPERGSRCRLGIPPTPTHLCHTVFLCFPVRSVISFFCSVPFVRSITTRYNAPWNHRSGCLIKCCTLKKAETRWGQSRECAAQLISGCVLTPKHHPLAMPLQWGMDKDAAFVAAVEGS